MEAVRLFSIISWISLPTVMFGGYSLLRFMARGQGLTPYQETYFRAGHAHAGVLLLLSLLYYSFLSQTNFESGFKWLACIVIVVGVLAQSGGFFLHMIIGQPGKPSLGNVVTIVGAVLLALACLTLAYGLIVA